MLIIVVLTCGDMVALLGGRLCSTCEEFLGCSMLLVEWRCWVGGYAAVQLDGCASAAARLPAAAARRGCVAFPCCCFCLHSQVPAIDCLAAHALSMLPTSRSLLPADPHAAWKLFCRAPPSAWQLRWARAACWAQSPWHQAHCCCPSADAAGERAGRPGKRGVTVLLLCCLRCAALLCCAVLQHPPPRCPLSLHARRPLIPRFAAHRDLALAGTWLWTTGW